MARPIYEIADEIYKVWGRNKINYAAKPYLEAMQSLNQITDKYMYDSARSVVSYFLANASAFRGDYAKRIKAELKALMG